MMKKEFIIEKWLDKPEQKREVKRSVKKINNDNNVRIEAMIHEIESKSIDITSDYNVWRNIGFALVDEFKEAGRSYFHRISKFYHEYDKDECDKQYDNCLKSNGNGITLGSLCHYALKAGITSKINSEKDPHSNTNLPNTLFTQLPSFIAGVIKPSESNPEERDLLLLGSIVCLGACLSKIHGIYDGKIVYPNLNLFISAPASSGKGVLSYCRQLVEYVHKRTPTPKFLEENSPISESEKLNNYETINQKSLFIPANNSSTGAYELLYQNGGIGLIFETEGDTLSLAFKSEHGNYSDGFRKAFHHEPISYYRRTDKEHVEIEKPRLSTLLSGTPNQIQTLIPSVENGLFSRFMFYTLDIKPEWKDIFAVNEGGIGLNEYYDVLGLKFHAFHEGINDGEDIQFSLTAGQIEKFNNFFEEKQSKYIALKGLDIVSIVRRSGLVFFRIAMILSVLRIMETGELPTEIICEDRDFESAMQIIEVLLKHADRVYSELPKEDKPRIRKNIRQRFLEALPEKFNRSEYSVVAEKTSISCRTADGYIRKFVESGLIHKDGHNKYMKITKEDKISVRK